MPKTRNTIAMLSACAALTAALTASSQEAVEVTGWVQTDYFEEITGTAVADLLDSDKFLDNQPDNAEWVHGINLIDGYGDNYGSRTVGWIVVAETGNYDFFVRSDDASQLFLSDDDTIPDPYFDFPICEETGCCNAFLEPPAVQATLEPRNLVAGRKYAFMFLQKEGGGGDWGQVAMRKEGDPTPAAELTPIGGANLVSLYDGPPIGLEITQQPQSKQAEQGKTATFTVAVEATSEDGDPPPVFYQWLKDGEEIPGATDAEYVTPILDLGDDAT